MAIDRVQYPHGRQESVEGVSTVEMIERLGRFEGPPEQFLVNMLAVQCKVSLASGGAILRSSAGGRPELLAIYPPVQQNRPVPVWLAQSVELAPKAITDGSTTVYPLHGTDDMYGQAAERHLVMVPLRGGGGVRGVSAFLVETRDDGALAASRERIELTTSLLSLYEMRLTLQQRQQNLRRLRMGMETLAAVNEHDRFTGAGMAICNETASRWSSDRVTLGFLKGRYVHLKSMSHTEKFLRKMKLIQDIESAMEECLDQDVEIIYPADPQSTYVHRATEELSGNHGKTAVLSLPLRRGGDAVGVLMLERPLDHPFTPDEVEAMRLTSELCTARLASLHEHDRWFGARMAATMRKGLGGLVGPRHTWAKVTVIAILCAILFLVFAKGNYNAEGKAVIKPIEQQMIQSPFDGHLFAVEVEPGARVKKGDLLARLDTEDLLAELDRAQAEMTSYQKQADVAQAAGRSKAAELQLAVEEVKRAKAEIKILQFRLRRADITSPIDGTVLTGEWKERIGATVKAGDLLFEVAPLDELRAELLIPEDQIADVKEELNLTGELATKQYPGRKLEFDVERVVPVAEVVDQKNVFKVRVRFKDLDLEGEHSWLLAGMEGIGRVHLGKRSYAWLWTHKLVNWIRMKLWI